MLSPQIYYVYALIFLVPALFLYLSYLHFRPSSQTQSPPIEPERKQTPLKTIMQAARDDLAPPKEDPFTVEELKEFDGSDPEKPVYVAIKGEFLPSPFSLPSSLFSFLALFSFLFLPFVFCEGAYSAVVDEGTIFDVSSKKDVYGHGRSYNIFAGKDASRGLGMSSLKPEDAVADYSGLGEKDRKVLDDWYGFFECVVSSRLFLCSLLLYMCVGCRKRYNIVGRVVDLPPPAAAAANL
jgi:membrane-associated progesterone receptor component